MALGLLLGYPDDDKAAGAQGGDGGGPLIEEGELVDEELGTDFGAGGGKDLGVNILVAGGALLIVAAPGEDHVPIGKHGQDGLASEVGGKSVYHHISGEPGVGWGKEAGVDVLTAGGAALPGEDGPAAGEQGDLGQALVAADDLVYPEGTAERG